MGLLRALRAAPDVTIALLGGGPYATVLAGALAATRAGPSDAREFTALEVSGPMDRREFIVR
jgi:hypothetical protein